VESSRGDVGGVWSCVSVSLSHTRRCTVSLGHDRRSCVKCSSMSRSPWRKVRPECRSDRVIVTAIFNVPPNIVLFPASPASYKARCFRFGRPCDQDRDRSRIGDKGRRTASNGRSRVWQTRRVGARPETDARIFGRKDVVLNERSVSGSRARPSTAKGRGTCG